MDGALLSGCESKRNPGKVALGGSDRNMMNFTNIEYITRYSTYILCKYG